MRKKIRALGAIIVIVLVLFCSCGVKNKSEDLSEPKPAEPKPAEPTPTKPTPTKPTPTGETTTGAVPTGAVTTGAVPTGAATTGSAPTETVTVEPGLTEATTSKLTPVEPTPIPEYRKISVEQAKSIMDEGGQFVLLDVRTEEEFKEQRIDGAVLIPNYEIRNRAEVELPDKGALILVYCRSGRRSAGAAEELVSMGYYNVYDFGGIIDWTFETVSG